MIALSNNFKPVNKETLQTHNDTNIISKKIAQL